MVPALLDSYGASVPCLLWCQRSALTPVLVAPATTLLRLLRSGRRSILTLSIGTIASRGKKWVSQPGLALSRVAPSRYRRRAGERL